MATVDDTLNSEKLVKQEELVKQKKLELVNILSEYYANSPYGIESEHTRHLAAQLNSPKEKLINFLKNKQPNLIFCQIMIGEVLERPEHSYSKSHYELRVAELAKTNAEKLISMLDYSQQQQLEFLLFKYRQALSSVVARSTRELCHSVWYEKIEKYLNKEHLDVYDEHKQSLLKQFYHISQVPEIEVKNMAERLIKEYTGPKDLVQQGRAATAERVKELKVELNNLIQNLSTDETFWKGLTRFKNKGKHIPIGVQRFENQSLSDIQHKAKDRYSFFTQPYNYLIRGRNPITNELYRLLSKVDLNEEKSLRKTIEEIKMLTVRNEPEVTKTTLK